MEMNINFIAILVATVPTSYWDLFGIPLYSEKPGQKKWALILLLNRPAVS